MFENLPAWARALPPVAITEAAYGAVDRNRGKIHRLAEATGVAGEEYTTPPGAFVGPYPGGTGPVAMPAPASAASPTLSLADAAARVSAESGGAPAPAAAPAAARGVASSFERGLGAYTGDDVVTWGGVDGLMTGNQSRVDDRERGRIRTQHDLALRDIALRGERDDPMRKAIAGREQTLDYERLLPYGSRSRLRFAVPKRDEDGAPAGMTDMMEAGYGERELGEPTAAEATKSLFAQTLERAKSRDKMSDPKVQQEHQRRQIVAAELEEMERAIEQGRVDRPEAERRFALRIQAITGMSLSEILKDQEETPEQVQARLAAEEAAAAQAGRY